MQRVIHFFWLVNQNIDGSIVQDTEFIREWLVSCVKCFGAFMDSTESFSQEGFESNIHDFLQYRIQVLCFSFFL